MARVHGRAETCSQAACDRHGATGAGLRAKAEWKCCAFRRSEEDRAQEAGVEERGSPPPREGDRSRSGRTAAGRGRSSRSREKSRGTRKRRSRGCPPRRAGRGGPDPRRGARSDQEDGRHQEDRSQPGPHGDDASARPPSGQARRNRGGIRGFERPSMRHPRWSPPRAIERAPLRAVAGSCTSARRIALDPLNRAGSLPVPDRIDVECRRRRVRSSIGSCSRFDDPARPASAEPPSWRISGIRIAGDRRAFRRVARQPAREVGRIDRRLTIL
jgi:hypothetical protein